FVSAHLSLLSILLFLFFFFTPPPTPQISTLSLHDALPICRALAVGMDVGDAGQVRDFVDRVVSELGRLDVMFANAGIAHSAPFQDRKSTRLNSSHVSISYAVFCLKKKKKKN